MLMMHRKLLMNGRESLATDFWYCVREVKHSLNETISVASVDEYHDNALSRRRTLVNVGRMPSMYPSRQCAFLKVLTTVNSSTIQSDTSEVILARIIPVSKIHVIKIYCVFARHPQLETRLLSVSGIA